MSRQHPGWEPGRLRAVRERAGLTRAELATRAGDISAQTVWRHETGRTWPDGKQRGFYCQVFRCGEADLGFCSDDMVEPRAADASPPSGPGVGPGEEATFRRDLLRAGAALGLTAAVGPAIDPSEQLLALENVTPANGALSVAEGHLAALVRAYLTTPPDVMLAQIVALQEWTETVGEQLRLPPKSQDRLWRLATVEAGMRGWVANNAGRHTETTTSLAAAFRRAELLEAPDLMAWIRYMQSVVAEYGGNPRESEDFANDGLRHAHGPLRAIILADRLGRAAAAQGDTDTVNRRLSEALNITQALPHEQQDPFGMDNTIVHHLSSCHPAFIAGCAGTAFAIAGEPDRASTFLADYQTELENSYWRPYLLLDDAEE